MKHLGEYLAHGQYSISVTVRFATGEEDRRVKFSIGTWCQCALERWEEARGCGSAKVAADQDSGLEGLLGGGMLRGVYGHLRQRGWRGGRRVCGALGRD